jgi:type II secretory pathway pseudopilin PulG
MRTRGTTLLETLVALALTAVMLAALGGAVIRAAAARSEASAAADRTATTRTVLLRLAAELEAARGGGETEPTAFERFVVDPPEPGRPWSRLRFATAAPGAFPETEAHGDVSAVTYDVEVEPGRPGTHALVRRETARPVPAGTPAALGVPVVGGVRVFRARCFDGTTWRPAWPAGPPPRAVELTLGAGAGLDGAEALTVTITLPTAAG